MNETPRCIQEYHINTTICMYDLCGAKNAEDRVHYFRVQSEECRGQSAEYRVGKVEGANSGGWRAEGQNVECRSVMPLCS